jgi:hypothetical protein
MTESIAALHSVFVAADIGLLTHEEIRWRPLNHPIVLDAAFGEL